MTLREYAAAVRKYWLVIIVLGALGAASGWGISQFLPDRYRAETTVMIIPARGDSTSELVQGSNYVQSLVQTYTVLARSPAVLQPVIDDLGLQGTVGQLAARTDVEAPLNTVVLEIGVTDGSGSSAQRVADAVATEFAVAVADTSPQGADGDPAVRVSVIAPASNPSSPVTPNTRLNTMLGGAAGLVIGVLAAIALRRFGGRIGGVEDLQETVDVPLLGTVGRASHGGVVAAMRGNPGGRVAESVRQTAAALKFVDMEGTRRLLLVSSASASEGKSSVAVALSLTLADVGHRVLLVDADLRRPSIAELTGLEGAVGLTTVLLGDATVAEAVQVWGHEGLHVLPSGPKPPNPGHVLSSDRVRAILDRARDSYEYVIVDTAPLLAVSDALWLARSADGTILVARADRTRRDAVRRATALLEGTPSPALGVVLNGVVVPRTPYDQRQG